MSLRETTLAGETSRTALVICTTAGRHLPVLLESIRQYVPTNVVVFLAGSDEKLFSHRTINLDNNASNFGDAYNAAVNYAFTMYDSIVVANDDIVLTPHSWHRLMADAAVYGEREDSGWVAARSDYARGWQNIRYQHYFDINGALFNASENVVMESIVVAPIFAYIRKKAWVDFPPINWYSDDVQCFDMKKAGLRHFISTSYVHHVGSQSVGRNFKRCNDEALEWCREHRPDFIDYLGGSLDELE